MKDISAIFNEFLLSMVNEKNASLIQELRHKWKEYLNQPSLPSHASLGVQNEKAKVMEFEYLHDVGDGAARYAFISTKQFPHTDFKKVALSIEQALNNPDTDKMDFPGQPLPQRTNPPLGLLPIKFWKIARLNEINAAIQRYIDAGKEIPKTWMDERTELLPLLNEQP